MNDDIKFILDSTQEAMDMAIKHLEKQFANIRAGKATPAMLGSVMVNYYGAQTPLSQVANVNTPDGRTITLETGKLAKQADGSVMLRMGNTMLLATVCAAKDAVPGTDS